MATYVIVPGIGGSGPGHWQTRWERGWAGAAVRIAPRSWDRPDLGDWVHAVQLAVSRAPAPDDRVVLVAHSLGCWAAAEWARARAPANVTALLVAPPDPQGASFPGAAAPSFRGLTAQALPCPALVVASGNDPYCTAGAARALARGWAAQWHLAGDRGHLNAESGLGDWPAGQRLLAGFLGGTR